MKPYVSVVTPTFNRLGSLERLLEALAKQTYPPTDFEVVVVDDGSTDGTVERVRGLALPYPLRILAQPHGGPARARNLGVEQARGTLIVFLDDDVVPFPDLIAAHVAIHEVDPDVVVVGPMSPPRDWSRPAWIRWEEEKLQLQYQAMLEGQYSCTWRQFYTGNASLSRAEFLAAGGFDPEFERAEDVELGYRLAIRGARFVFDPRADVLHYPARSFESWCRTPYQYGYYDVVMHRDKGYTTMFLASQEFYDRNLLNRFAARLCVGRPILLEGAVFGLARLARAAERLGARRVAASTLSGIFNLLYWQGVCDALGGAEHVWRSVAASGAVRA